MHTRRLPFLACLAASLVLPWSVSARNNISEPGENISAGTGQCPLHVLQEFDSDAPINSTGRVNIHWNALMMDPARNDWIFTLTYNETRNQQVETQHRLQAYISAPEESEAQACVHMFGGLNASSWSSEANGCDGVLDSICYEFLSNTTFNSGCVLPGPRLDWLDGLRDACGADVAKSLTSTGTPQDFTNKTCTIDHPPGSDSSDGYRTWAAIGRGSIDGDTADSDASIFTWYDIYVQQTIPFLITANFLGGVTETRVVCVAPKKVVEGGRAPAKLSAANWGRRHSMVAVAFVVTIGAMNALV